MREGKEARLIFKEQFTSKSVGMGRKAPVPLRLLFLSKQIFFGFCSTSICSSAICPATSHVCFSTPTYDMKIFQGQFCCALPLSLRRTRTRLPQVPVCGATSCVTWVGYGDCGRGMRAMVPPASSDACFGCVSADRSGRRGSARAVGGEAAKGMERDSTWTTP